MLFTKSNEHKVKFTCECSFMIAFFSSVEGYSIHFHSLWCVVHLHLGWNEKRYFKTLMRLKCICTFSKTIFYVYLLFSLPLNPQWWNEKGGNCYFFSLCWYFYNETNKNSNYCNIRVRLNVTFKCSPFSSLCWAFHNIVLEYRTEIEWVTEHKVLPEIH